MRINFLTAYERSKSEAVKYLPKPYAVHVVKLLRKLSKQKAVRDDLANEVDHLLSEIDQDPRLKEFHNENTHPD